MPSHAPFALAGQAGHGRFDQGRLGRRHRPFVMKEKTQLVFEFELFQVAFLAAFHLVVGQGMERIEARACLGAKLSKLD